MPFPKCFFLKILHHFASLLPPDFSLLGSSFENLFFLLDFIDPLLYFFSLTSVFSATLPLIVLSIDLAVHTDASKVCSYLTGTKYSHGSPLPYLSIFFNLSRTMCRENSILLMKALIYSSIVDC